MLANKKLTGACVAALAALGVLAHSGAALATVHCYAIVGVGPELVCDPCIDQSCDACVNETCLTPLITICVPLQVIFEAPEGVGGMTGVNIHERPCCGWWTCAPPLPCAGADCRRGLFTGNCTTTGWQEYLEGDPCHG